MMKNQKEQSDKYQDELKYSYDVLQDLLFEMYG